MNEHSLANPGGTARAQIPANGVAPTATPAAPRTGTGAEPGGSLPLQALAGLGLVMVALSGAAWSRLVRRQG